MTAPLSRQELQRRTVAGAVWTSIHALTAAPVAFVANAVVARVLGVEDYGRLAVLTLALGLAVQISNLNVSEGVIQWGAAAHAEGRDEDARLLLRKSLGFHLLVQLPVLIVFVLLIARNERFWVQGALIFAVAMPAGLGSAALTVSLQNRMASAAKLGLATNALLQSAIVVSALTSGTAASVWATRSVAGSVLLPLNFLLLHRGWRRNALRVAAPRDMPSGFWQFCIYGLGAGLVGTLVYSRSEVLLLQVLSGAAAVGVFALAHGLSQQVTGPVDAVTASLVSGVAGLLATDASAGGRALVRAVSLLALVCGLMMSGLLPALYLLIPVVYGDEFSQTAALVVPLVLISFLQTMLGPFLAFLQARKATRTLFGIQVQALLVNVLLAVPLILTLGVWGAVAANAAGQAASLLLVVKEEVKHVHVGSAQLLRSTLPWSLGAVLGLALVAFVVVVPTAPLLAPVVGVVGLALHGGIVRVLGLGLETDEGLSLLAALPRGAVPAARRLLQFQGTKVH